MKDREKKTNKFFFLDKIEKTFESKYDFYLGYYNFIMSDATMDLLSTSTILNFHLIWLSI